MKKFFQVGEVYGWKSKSNANSSKNARIVVVLNSDSRREIVLTLDGNIVDMQLSEHHRSLI